MKLSHSFACSLTATLLVGLVQGAEILDTPVPWSGRLKNYSMAELVARMSGWADLEPGSDFRFAERLPPDLANKRIDLIQIAEEPRPTYRELLVSSLAQVNRRAMLSRGKSGIEILYLYTRTYQLPTTTKQALYRKKRLSLEGIKQELDDKGWAMSPFAVIQFFPENSSVLVRGTKEDVEMTSRFFGVN